MDDVFESIVKRVISTESSTTATDFDRFVTACMEETSQPVHSIQEMRHQRSTKRKGDLFETFCIRYLHSKGYEAWLLRDVPQDILDACGMTRFDVGIDAIARKQSKAKAKSDSGKEKQRVLSAVQCKFKTPRPGFVKGTWLPYNCVNWKEVSTFYSLCHRTQAKANWERHIVMTNTMYVRRMGDPTPYDRTYAYRTFCGMSRMDWVRSITKKLSVTRRLLRIEEEDGTETLIMNVIENPTDPVKLKVNEQEKVDLMRMARLAKFCST